MKYAIVKDEVVTNLVEWDGVSPFTVDGQLILATEDAWIGGGYVNGAFVPPPPPPPPSQEELDLIAAKESAIAKLVSVLGLTPEEQAALGF